jgi:hypothetical protein
MTTGLILQGVNGIAGRRLAVGRPFTGAPNWLEGTLRGPPA